jgi:hypothetical protein
LKKYNLKTAKGGWCIECSCTICMAKPIEERRLSGTKFESHAGMGSSKKWRESIKYLPARKAIVDLLPK